MKRSICIAVLLSFLLCGCDGQQYEAGTFSYTEHCAEYANAELGVSILEPQGQKKVRVRNADDAVAVAMKYCVIRSPEISVAFDEYTGVYCVGFIYARQVVGRTVYGTGGQTVYLNEDGIVLLDIVGE